MRRVLAGAIVAVAAFSSIPAHAAQDLGIYVVKRVDENGVFVGAGMGRQPIGGAGYNTTTQTFCAGMSYQVPQCVTVPIQIQH